MRRNQDVSDLQAEVERGQARKAVPGEPAKAIGVEVVDLDGTRVGEVSDAAVLLEEAGPRVVVALDEEVRRKYHLKTNALDVETKLVKRHEDGSVQLLETLPDLLRREGFDI